MRSSIVADAIIYTKRAELTKMAADHLKLKGVSNVLTPATADDAIDALKRFPKALLVVDWENGAADAVKVLSHNRQRFSGQLRPILLVAPKVSEQLIATAAEYSVSQIYTEELSPKNLGARISNMILGETIPDEIKKALGDMYDARAGGDMKTSTQILMALLQKHPTNLRIKCEAAEMLMQLGENDRALKVLEGMDKTKPPYLRGIHLLGRVLMKAGRFEDGLKILQQASLFNPHDTDRLVDIGQALLNLDRVDDAKAKFDEAAEADPEHRGAKIGQGQCKLMDGEVNEALELLKEISGDLEKASIFNTCAVLNMRQGRHKAGMSLYQSALTALGKDKRLQARLHFNMGIGYRRWGKKDKAQECMEEALKADKNFEKAHLQLEMLRSPAPQKEIAADEPMTEDIFGVEDLSSDLDSMLEESLFNGRKPA